MSTQNGLVEYEPGMISDTLMVQLYGRMGMDEEIESLFHDVYCVSDFLRQLTHPTQTVYKCDDKGIWFMALYTPYFVGATFDMYVAPHKRAGKKWVRAMCEALERGFERWPVLLGITSQENLVDDHIRMGYVVTGKIPGLWHGKDVTVMHITRQSFEARETFIIQPKGVL